MERVRVEICLKFPPKVNAPGLMTLLSNDEPENIMDYSAPRLELQMIVTFILTQAIHFVLKRLRIPIFMSQIIAGIILGPMFFRHDKSLITMSEDSVSILGTVASFGYLFFLFLTGVKMDFSMTYRSGKKALCIGILTVLVPSIVCLFMARSAPEEGRLYRANDVYILAVAHSLTSFPKCHNLSCCTGVLFSTSNEMDGEENGWRWEDKWCLPLCCNFGVHGFTQGYRYFESVYPLWSISNGVGHPRWTPLGSALVEKMEPVVSGFLMPLFASTCGMRIDFSYLNNSTPFVKHQALSAIVAVLVKFGVSFLVSFCCKIPTRDSLAFAFIMISKGCNKSILAYMTLIIIVVASIVPMLVKALYDPSRKYASYQKRSIMHCKINEELRMISCIHIPANVNSIIDILSTSTTETPIALHVLHLIKLSGRATPLFISHDMNQHTLSNNYYSENVVLSFRRFERDNWGAVSVKAFTAVSPTNMMYEDICNLALDHHTSFIILPFHRRWHFNGSIESEDQTIRSLNYSMLEKAPCSIGILVEGRRNLNGTNPQSSLGSSSSYNIAVIFLGGKDDQEALALGLRMSENKNVQLTIIHLTSGNMFLADDTETMQDEIMLRNVKENLSYIKHIEKQVSDGPETLDFFDSMWTSTSFSLSGDDTNVKIPRPWVSMNGQKFKRLEL
ncbi:Lipase 1 isoform 1 [Hibiscus syriacus]|uniref:Lipase 1 isoform 1 n=1 Tax=Hibiscus syriacus TaxID=106335 RepID=A0A6A3A8N6_HIBSY|nr:Lipase 1 isoform 1 [Hibiscus syriacus]